MCYESTCKFGGHHADCGCGPTGHQGMREHSHHQQGCCCHPGYGMRRFPTREEMITETEEYLKQLHAEVKGVEEHLSELKRTQA
ncbi:MAG: hypothetical protein PHN78_05500 [Dehalococcoidales bacterium]|nr:hypothetical protein [Dehalococcoidales bacterium]